MSKISKLVCVGCLLVGFNFVISLPEYILKNTILQNSVKIVVVDNNKSEEAYFIDKEKYNDWLINGDDLETQFHGTIDNSDINCTIQVYSRFCNN